SLCTIKALAASLFAVGATVLVIGGASAQDEPLPQTLFTNVNVWNGTSDGLVENARVLVEGNLIKTVGDETLKGGAHAVIIDGGGRTMLPGFIDMHAHLATAEGLPDGRDEWDAYAIGAIAAHNLVLFLDQGFTTVRGAGGPDLGLAKAINAGRIPGPRFYPSGPWLTQTGGHADLGYWTDPVGFKDYSELTETSHVVDGSAEILKAVRYNLRKGATQIKLMAGGGVSSAFDPIHVTQFTEDEIRTAVEAAEDWGTYVLVHAYHDRSVNRAIDAGAKSIEHGALISEATVKRMADEGVVWSLQGFVGFDSFSDPAKMPDFFSELQKAKAIQLFEGWPKVSAWAKKHGVFIVSGGDTFGVELMKKNIENIIIETVLGFTPQEALVHATSNPGKMIKEMGLMDPGLDPYPDGKLGVIEAGAYADLLIVEGNPLEDLTVLRDYQSNLRVIMKDGEFHKNTL
ncbi:MAG: amidohydrolase family protein, partial [bacterium]|nr:amidohydrolase family protein [bacterium]